MGKKKQAAGEDLAGQLLGALGGLVVVFGVLSAIRDKLGLGWPALMALLVGTLALLGYAAWWARARVLRAWNRNGAAAPATAAVAKAVEAAAEQPQEPQHEAWTIALRRAGSIAQDEYIRAADVRTEQIDVGTRYRFLLPAGRTHAEVSKRLPAIASMFGVTRLHLRVNTSRASERQVEVLVLKEQPFSVPFDPPTRQEIRSFAGVPLGHEITGELGGVRTFSRASMLVAGMSQMGKTTLVNGMITCLLIAYGEFDLYLLDGKFCGLARFEKIAVRYEASEDPAVLESMLDELIVRLNGRYQEILEAEKGRREKPKFKPVFFIIDEAADFYTDNGTQKSKECVGRVIEKSRKVAGKSLESEISVIMLTQRPDKEAIPTKVRSQLQYRVCMYVGGEGDAKVALGDDYFNTVAPINPVHLDPHVKGQAVVYAGGKSSLLRGFNFSDEFIWEVVDEVHERQQRELQTALETVPNTPIRQAIDLMEERGITFIPTADLAQHFGLTAKTASQLGKEVAALLPGVKARPDGSKRGYDLDALTAAAQSRT